MQSSRSSQWLSLCAVIASGVLISRGQSAPNPPERLSDAAIPVDPQDLDIVDVPVDALAVSATFDTPIEEIEIPAYAQRLSGRRVRLRGMMYPPFQDSGLTDYWFLPETRGKTFNVINAGKIPLHGLIQVTTPAGHSEDYTTRPIAIEGTFDIQIEIDEGEIVQFYVLRNAKIVEQNVKLRGHPIGGFGC